MNVEVFPQKERCLSYSVEFFANSIFSYLYEKDISCRDEKLTQQLRIALYHCKNPVQVLFVLDALSASLSVFINLQAAVKNYRQHCPEQHPDQSSFFLRVITSSYPINYYFSLIFSAVISTYLKDKSSWFTRREMVSPYNRIILLNEVMIQSGVERQRKGLRVENLGEFWF